MALRVGCGVLGCKISAERAALFPAKRAARDRRERLRKATFKQLLNQGGLRRPGRKNAVVALKRQHNSLLYLLFLNAYARPI